MIRVLFLDVDGTLVDYENRLPDSAIAAVRRARERGCRVYICTGRSKAEVYPPLWDLGLDGMIGGNGSYVEDRGQVVLHRTLSGDQCRQVVDWLHRRGLEFYLESNSGLYGSEHFETAALEAVRAYMGRKGKDTAGVTVRAVFPEMIFGGALYREDVNKVSFLLRSPQDAAGAALAFPELRAGTRGGAGAAALFGDLGPRDAGKDRAVEALLRHLGLTPGEAAAFGDAAVDIPMFRACGYSVCMGNGSPEAKAAADFVTDSVENDGLLKAFQRLGLV